MEVGVGVGVVVIPPLRTLGFGTRSSLDLGLPLEQYVGFEHPRVPPPSSMYICPVGSVYLNGLFAT